MTDDILMLTYGQNWAFYPEFNLTEGVVMAKGAESVRQSLQLLFLTEHGERIMREDYGAGMNDFMFANISDDLLARIHSRIEDNILRYEPRAALTDILIQPDRQQASRLTIQITWRLKGSDIDQRLEGTLALNEAASLRLI